MRHLDFAGQTPALRDTPRGRLPFIESVRHHRCRIHFARCRKWFF
jgi:hypothetical protein